MTTTVTGAQFGAYTNRGQDTVTMHFSEEISDETKKHWLKLRENMSELYLF